MTSPTKDLVIVGVGATAPTWSTSAPETSLMVEAALLACADAGLDPSAIDGILGEAYSTPRSMSELHAALRLRPDVFSANTGLVGSGAVATTMLAEGAIAAGHGEVFLCVYGLNLSLTDGPGSHHSADPYKANMEMPFGFFPQPIYMATMTTRYLAQYGVEPGLLGSVARSARAWAGLTPDALSREPLSEEQYQASPLLADPLRKEDCCLISDGACAFIVTTRERAADLRHRPVEVLGVARAVEPVPSQEYLGVRADHLNLPSRISGPAALKQAGLKVGDIDLVYLYDCFSIIPVLQLEDIGFCNPGEGLEFFASGASAPGGPLPVNTFGGLLAHSYVPGINMVVEAVLQLRGAAGPERQQARARTALVGAWADTEHTTLILGAA